MLEYYIMFYKQKNPFKITIFHVISVCLWLHIQSLADIVTVLVCCTCMNIKLI
jgi:hypothetical protein